MVWVTLRLIILTEAIHCCKVRTSWRSRRSHTKLIIPHNPIKYFWTHTDSFRPGSTSGWNVFKHNLRQIFPHCAGNEFIIILHLWKRILVCWQSKSKTIFSRPSGLSCQNILLRVRNKFYMKIWNKFIQNCIYFLIFLLIERINVNSIGPRLLFENLRLSYHLNFIYLIALYNFPTNT